MELSNISNEKWYEMLINGTDIESFKEIVPKLPTERIQLNFTGTSGTTTLSQAFSFYKIIKENLGELNKILDKDTKLLDFGTGWGRIIRFWIKDIDKKNLYGVDPLPEMIKLCSDTIKCANFFQIESAPPIKHFEPGTFDLITAYSVFSHLNEEYTNKWFSEFHSLLKDDGLLIVTTRSREFINYCATISKTVAKEEHARTIPMCFNDYEKVLCDYDSGKFIHQATGGGGILSSNFFGETCIPKKYFEKFNKQFTIHKFIDCLDNEPTQSMIVFKKAN